MVGCVTGTFFPRKVKNKLSFPLSIAVRASRFSQILICKVLIAFDDFLYLDLQSTTGKPMEALEAIDEVDGSPEAIDLCCFVEFNVSVIFDRLTRRSVKFKKKYLVLTFVND
jgi:hypothetical protein